MKLPDKLEIMIITLSDRAFKGEYKDLSGPKIKEMVSEYFTANSWKFEIKEVLIPDDEELLREQVIKASEKHHFIFTTGGTGIGPKDITVETITPLLTKEIPGIMEYIRVKYGSLKPNALLSRGIAGVIGKSLIYTLPGSVRGVTEYMTEIVKTLEHSLFMLYGIDNHGEI
jgi:molybdenum cofactor synthesis domain-containing protein